MYSDDDLSRLLAKTDWELPFGHLSPSQVWSYISCPACYEAERVLKIPRPVNADLLIGLQAHRSARYAREELIAGRVDPERPDAPAFMEAVLEAGAEQFEGVIAAGQYSEEPGEVIPVEVELTRKYADLGAAKDVGVKLTKVAVPEMLRYDLKAEVQAVEARVWHLGTPLDPMKAHTHYEAEDFALEAKEQAEYGILPVFPFPVKAYLDVLYGTGALKDYKTSSRSGAPDGLATIQLVMYGAPWQLAGEPRPMGWDVAIKTKLPGFASYWLRSQQDESLPPGRITDDEFKYIMWRVLRAAEGISAGRFDPNDGSIFCKYRHGLPEGERAVTNFVEAVA